MDGPYDFEEKILAAYHKDLEDQAIRGMKKPVLVTLLTPADKPVFSADPVTMSEWLTDNPPEGGYGVRIEPDEKIVTVDYFLAMMEWGK